MTTKKKVPSKNRSNHAKRTARSAPKSSAEKQARDEARRAEEERIKKEKQTSTRGKKIAAVFFSVLLILAFAIPSVSVLMSNSNSADAADEAYDERVAEATAEIEADESGTVGYGNLGDVYFEWADNIAAGEVSSNHEASEIYGLAIEAYTTYLEQNTDTSAQIKLAQAQLATGSSTQAAQTLQEVLAAEPENVEAWARLGDVYASVDDVTDATTAYNRAIELDADGSAGWNAYATEALEALNATDDADADSSEDADSGEDADSSEDADSAPDADSASDADSSSQTGASE